MNDDKYGENNNGFIVNKKNRLAQNLVLKDDDEYEEEKNIENRNSSSD
jgi:hypothetical protein